MKADTVMRHFGAQSHLFGWRANFAHVQRVFQCQTQPAPQLLQPRTVTSRSTHPNELYQTRQPHQNRCCARLDQPANWAAGSRGHSHLTGTCPADCTPLNTPKAGRQTGHRLGNAVTVLSMFCTCQCVDECACSAPPHRHTALVHRFPIPRFQMRIQLCHLLRVLRGPRALVQHHLAERRHLTAIL